MSQTTYQKIWVCQWGSNVRPSYFQTCFYFDGAQLWQRPCLFCPTITVYDTHFAVSFLKAHYTLCNVDIVLNKRYQASSSRCDGRQPWDTGINPLPHAPASAFQIPDPLTKGVWATGSFWPSQPHKHCIWPFFCSCIQPGPCMPGCAPTFSSENRWKLTVFWGKWHINR